MNIDYDQLQEYAIILMYQIPNYVYEGLTSVLCLGFVVLFIWKGFRGGAVLTCRLFLFEFLFILYCSTIIFREDIDTRGYCLRPFWSYEEILGGRSELLAENIMNAIVFMPVGLLISFGFPKLSWRKAIGFGSLFSISIETLQFLFKRGFCELDDVMHNTLGCAIGFGIAQLIMIVYSAIIKQNK